MPLTPTHRAILSLLRPQRTERSWIAGSLVLHEILAREVGDIDIHHATHGEMRANVDRDTDILKRNGFRVMERKESRSEIEYVLRGAMGEVALNWVETADARLLPLEPDSQLGWRISVPDAVFQKLSMAFDGDEHKHLQDLADCVRSGVLTEDLIRRAAERQSWSDPETYIHRVSAGLSAVAGTLDLSPEVGNAVDAVRGNPG